MNVRKNQLESDGQIDQPSQGKSRRRPHGRQRRGAAAVECAFCIPVIIILMFATLETCSGIFLKETLTVAAYEGVRVGVRRRATAAAVEARCQAILDARNVQNATITITPSNFDSLDALDPITVTVSAPTAGNSLFIFDFMADRTASAEVSMLREFDD